MSLVRVTNYLGKSTNLTTLNLLPRSRIVILLLSLAAALLWQSPAILRVSRSIKTDSFATLSPLGGLGLVVLTLLLVSGLFLINSQLSARFISRIQNHLLALPLRLLLAFCLFTLFWATSPQIYYLYYQFLFDGLPWQMVIKDWFPFRTAFSLLVPGNIENSSFLSAAITLVTLLMQTALGYRIRK